MFLHYLDASAVGGIETHVETLALAQIAAGRPAAVILHKDHPGSSMRKRYEDAGLQVHVAGGARGLARLLTSHRPALLHTHGYKAGIIARTIAPFLSVPLVSTFHAGERGKGRMALYQHLDEWTSFAVERIAVSNEIAERMPFRTRVIRNFVPLTEEMRKPPLQTTFVFAGRLSHEKGPDLFCALASRNRQSGRFEIHGDGPMRLELEQRYGDMVRFHGFTSDMKAALSQATALILTSRSEGLPMIALEAMAMGVPVIAPALGGLPDLVSHGSNGYLYEPQNLSALEDSLSCFRKLDHGQIAEMGMAARDVISAHYSPGAVLPELFRVYGRAGVKSERSMRTKVQSSIG